MTTVHVTAGDAPGPPTLTQAPPQPQKSFGECLMPALLAALPAFLNALMQCMSGNGGGSNYNPGTRSRC